MDGEKLREEVPSEDMDLLRIELPDTHNNIQASDLDISPTLISHTIHYYTEKTRLEYESGLLKFDHQLSNIAVAHSRDMRTREYIGHNSPDGDGLSDRIDRFDYTPPETDNKSRIKYGENIVRSGYKIPLGSDSHSINYTIDSLSEHIVEQWLDSAGHRENLLDNEWDREGIGTALYPYQSGAIVFVTQVFCNK